MLGRQSSDERLYMKRNAGGRGLKSLRDVYTQTRLRVACYMATSSNRWIKAAWERELFKESGSIKDDAVTIMQLVEKKIEFAEEKSYTRR